MIYRIIAIGLAVLFIGWLLFVYTASPNGVQP